MAEALVPGPSHRVALCDDRDERHRDQELPDPPPCTGRTLRHAFSDDAIALIHQVGRECLEWSTTSPSKPSSPRSPPAQPSSTDRHICTSNCQDLWMSFFRRLPPRLVSRRVVRRVPLLNVLLLARGRRGGAHDSVATVCHSGREGSAVRDLT